MLPSPVLRCLKNSNLVFLVAFLLGLIFGDPAPLLKESLIPALVLIMSLSTTQIDRPPFARLKNYRGDIVSVFLINYVFLSGLILLTNAFLVRDHDLYAGFVVMAAVPSAVSIMPFAYLLRGDLMVSLFGSIALYLLALLMAPLITWAFLDVGRIGIGRFIYTLALIIILPFIISRILLKWRFFHRVREHTGILVNLAFFLAIYVVIGMNRSTFLGHFNVLMLISFMAFLRTFFSGHLLDCLLRMAGVDRERRISYVLFGSYKNLTLAATLSIILFNERSAIPSAVAIPFEFLFFVWFNFFLKRQG